MSDWELIVAFVGEGSEAAFTELVERHVNLVYSAARRLVRDAQLAEDVTQQVFVLLARKAGRFGRDTIVSAWLYRAARNIASESLRRDVRWRRREEIAMAERTEAAVENWSEIEPHLDEVMGKLCSADHDAIVLRYFENKSLRAVAEVLGASEDAAQKRVSRALERLRTLLVQRGVTTTAGVVGACVSAAAVQAAPEGVAKRAADMTHACMPKPSTILPPSGRLVIPALVGVVSIVLFLAHRTNVSLRDELARQQSALNAIQVARDVRQDDEELLRLRKAHFELLSLRGQVAQLRKELRSAPRAKEESEESARAENKEDSIFFTASLTNRVAPRNTLVVGGWMRDGSRGYLLVTPSVDATNSGQLILKSKVVRAPEKFWDEIGWGSYKSDLRRSSLAGVLGPEHIEQLISLLKVMAGADITNESITSVSDGGKASFGWSVSDDAAEETLMMIDVYPRVASDGKAIEVELKPTPAPDGLELRRELAQTPRSGN